MAIRVSACLFVIMLKMVASVIIMNTDIHLLSSLPQYRDREFLMERNVEIDKKTKTVVARYKSVEHPSKPLRRNVIRGETQNTFWRFSSLKGGKTEIHVESEVSVRE